MIMMDTETTGLLAPEAAPLEQQPHMVEFAAIKVHPKTLAEQGRLTFLLRPGARIPEDAIAIHHISNEMVRDALPFPGHYPVLCNFFGGQRAVVAHNLSFDIGVLYYELRRIGKVTQFPWPPTQICTVEATMGIKGRRLNLAELHEMLTGIPHKEGAHRGLADCEALLRVVRELRKMDLI